MTYEQFVALKVAETKVAIGKGLITLEECFALFHAYQ
jgi:hypothetical protein